MEKMEELNEDEYKDIDSLIETLKENVSTWKDKLDNERQNTKSSMLATKNSMGLKVKTDRQGSMRDIKEQNKE